MKRKKATLPTWFEGKVYKNSGLVRINRDGKSTLRLDNHALSIYYLIRGYQQLDRINDKDYIAATEQFKTNYPDEWDVLFVNNDTNKERNKTIEMLNEYISKTKRDTYNLFNGKY